jgi:hypothetical protein
MVTKHFLLPVFSLLDAQTLMLSLLVSNVSEYLPSFQKLILSQGWLQHRLRTQYYSKAAILVFIQISRCCFFKICKLFSYMPTFCVK